jgi:hypothetical protein
MEACLNALAQQGLGKFLSIGGGVGLLHYLDYRPTHDIDAWWMPAATPAERVRVIDALETTLARWGEVRIRRWGEVVSLDLVVDGHAVFSFQLAQRTARLEPVLTLPWVEVYLDSLADLTASKMVALIERGAPRDFRDIYALCQAGLMTPAQCWDLWRQRQRLAGSDTGMARAKLAIESHLARIEQHRPLPEIADQQQRTQAVQVRNWYREVLLHEN